MSYSILPMFYSFIVSGLTLRSLNNFAFIFVYNVRKCSNFILSHVTFFHIFTSILPMLLSFK